MTSLVLCHGAWGGPADWDAVLERAALERVGLEPPPAPLRLDLLDISVGMESTEVSGIWDRAIEAIVEQLLPGPLLLAGYSLGGRLLLGLSQHEAIRPRVRGVLLVGATAGLVHAADRAARVVVDDERAAWQAHDPAAFLDAFWRLPLFVGLHAHPQRSAWLAERVARARRAPTALAHLMRGLSVGRMPPLWDALPSLAVPVVVVNGALDPECVVIGDRLVAALPMGRHEIVQEASHALLLEAPAAVGAALAQLCTDVIEASP
jgi:pimeloyl-ACP methyl ester carboxylesterase